MQMTFLIDFHCELYHDGAEVGSIKINIYYCGKIKNNFKYKSHLRINTVFYKLYNIV